MDAKVAIRELPTENRAVILNVRLVAQQVVRSALSERVNVALNMVAGAKG